MIKMISITDFDNFDKPNNSNDTGGEDKLNEFSALLAAISAPPEIKLPENAEKPAISGERFFSENADQIKSVESPVNRISAENNNTSDKLTEIISAKKENPEIFPVTVSGNETSKKPVSLSEFLPKPGLENEVSANLPKPFVKNEVSEKTISGSEISTKAISESEMPAKTISGSDVSAKTILEDEVSPKTVLENKTGETMTQINSAKMSPSAESNAAPQLKDLLLPENVEIVSNFASPSLKIKPEIVPVLKNYGSVEKVNNFEDLAKLFHKISVDLKEDKIESSLKLKNSILPSDYVVNKESAEIKTSAQAVLTSDFIVKEQADTPLPTASKISDILSEYVDLSKVSPKQSNSFSDYVKPELIIPKGEVIIPKPELTVPKGEVIIPKPELTVPKGEVIIPKPELAVPKGEVVIPKPELINPKSEVVIPKSEKVTPKHSNSFFDHIKPEKVVPRQSNSFSDYVKPEKVAPKQSNSFSDYVVPEKVKPKQSVSFSDFVTVKNEETPQIDAVESSPISTLTAHISDQIETEEIPQIKPAQSLMSDMPELTAQTFDRIKAKTENLTFDNADVFISAAAENPAIINNDAPQITANSKKVFEQIASQVEPEIFIFAGKPQKTDILKLRLHPAELGTVEIRLEKSESGIIRAHFQTETEGARQIIVEHLGELRQALQNSGLKLENLDVSCDSFSSAGNDNRDEQSRRTEMDENKFAQAENFDDVSEIKDASIPNRLVNLRA